MVVISTTNLGAQDYFATTLTGSVAVSDTVINVAAVPNASEGYLVLEPNNASTREIIHYTSKGASSVTCPDATAGSGRGVGGTTVQTHSSGATVVMNVTAEYWLDLQSGVASIAATNHNKESHTNYVVSGCVPPTSGTLSATTTSGVVYLNGRRFSVASSAQTYTASKDTYLYLKDNGDGTSSYVQNSVANNAAAPAVTLNADGSNALLVAKVVTSGSAITSVTQSGSDSNGVQIYPINSVGFNGFKQFTPSWTNLTVGNGTNQGWYLQVGKVVKGYIKVVLGSTSSVGTGPWFTAPVAVAANYDNTHNFPVGTAFYNVAGGSYPGWTHVNTNLGTNALQPISLIQTNAQATGLGASTPAVWTTTNYVTLGFEYEAA